MKVRAGTLVLVLSLLIVGAGIAQGQNREVSAKDNDAKTEQKSDQKKDLPRDTVSVTKHSIKINGVQITYTAAAGKLVMKDDEGKVKAQIFFVAYTKNDVQDLSQRPITFAFNGGPGSSSVWLHIGILGPLRIKLPDDATQLPPPYQFNDNPYSLLDVTDLVFIDPVSTGFSRPAEGEKGDQFHGYEEDLRSVGQFIHDYVTKYGRWQSPKFLIGESYGGLRAAGLSGYLRNRYNLTLNGIIMISPALNFETIDFEFGNDLPYILFVPGYTATAWYHKALPDDLQKLPLDEAVKQATAFARSDYALAMMKGQSLDDAERDAIAEKLSRYTGLSKEFVINSKLRIGMERFSKELLRKQGRSVGRFDSRYKGIDIDNAKEAPDYDASAEAVFAPFTSVINDYLHSALKVEDEHVYEILSDKVHPWNYGRHMRQFPDATNTLRESMSANPFLKLFVASGFYDLATPAATVQYSVEHLRLPQELQKNIVHNFYEGGHMMYIYEPAMKQLRKDLEKFYASALKRDGSDKTEKNN